MQGRYFRRSATDRESHRSFGDEHRRSALVGAGWICRRRFGAGCGAGELRRPRTQRARDPRARRTARGAGRGGRRAAAPSGPGAGTQLVAYQRPVPANQGLLVRRPLTAHGAARPAAHEDPTATGQTRAAASESPARPMPNLRGFPAPRRPAQSPREWEQWHTVTRKAINRQLLTPQATGNDNGPIPHHHLLHTRCLARHRAQQAAARRLCTPASPRGPPGPASRVRGQPASTVLREPRRSNAPGLPDQE